MKLKLCFIAAVFTIFGASGLLQAATLNFPANIGNNGGTGCSVTANGYVTGSVAGCNVMIAIPIDAGKTISSVTFYYSDTTGSQFINGAVVSHALSTNTVTTLSSFSDNTTAATVQFNTRTVNVVTSSANAYFATAFISQDTRFVGIKVVYL